MAEYRVKAFLHKSESRPILLTYTNKKAAMKAGRGACCPAIDHVEVTKVWHEGTEEYEDDLCSFDWTSAHKVERTDWM